MPPLTVSESQNTRTAPQTDATPANSRVELLESARRQDRKWREARVRSVQGQIRWLDAFPHRSSRAVFWVAYCGILLLLLLLTLTGSVSPPPVKQLVMTPLAAFVAAWAATATWRAAASPASHMVRRIVLRRARNAGVEVEE